MNQELTTAIKNLIKHNIPFNLFKGDNELEFDGIDYLVWRSYVSDTPVDVIGSIDDADDLIAGFLTFRDD